MRITIRRITMTQIDIDFGLNTGYSTALILFRKVSALSLVAKMGIVILAMYLAGFLLTQAGALLTALTPVAAIGLGIFCTITGLIWAFRWLQARMDELVEWWIHLWERAPSFAIVPVRPTRLNEKHRFLV